MEYAILSSQISKMLFWNLLYFNCGVVKNLTHEFPVFSNDIKSSFSADSIVRSEIKNWSKIILNGIIFVLVL